VVAAAEAPEPAAEPAPVVAPTPPPEAEPPAPELPPPAPVGCKATIRTAPRGAVVRWNGQKVGVTPVEDVPVACGEAIVVLDRPRHDVEERKVLALDGTPTVLDVTLHRPAGKLDVVTSPAGATVTVNGAPVGRSPARANVEAFTSVKVVASLPGHKPWSKTVYVRGREYRVTAGLMPAPGRKSARLRADQLDRLVPAEPSSDPR
jgi:hypothetical protein